MNSSGRVPAALLNRRAWLLGCSTAAVLGANRAAPLRGAGTEVADEFFVVSTRGISSEIRCADLHSPRFRVSAADPGGRLFPISPSALFAGDGRPSIVYVHGNRVTHDYAIEQGWEIFQRVTASRTVGTPIRWIVWSWPSERTGLCLRDVRTKARRADAQGLYLAWTLRRMAGSGPLNLVGYSYGARVATGSLHALAGGPLGGRALPEGTLAGLPVGISLVAPAVDADWLGPGRHHGRSGQNMERLTVLYNSSDPVLRAYWRVDRERRVPAMGYTGVLARPRRADGSLVPVWMRDCWRSVGPRHFEDRYYREPCNAGRVLARDIERSYARA